MLKWIPSDRSGSTSQDQSQEKDDKLSSGGRFKYNSQNPLKLEEKGVDEKDWSQVDAVLLDEASMLDLPLAAALLEALPSRCQLVFVGQPLLLSSNQLRRLAPLPKGCTLLCHACCSLCKGSYAVAKDARVTVHRLNFCCSMC